MRTIITFFALTLTCSINAQEPSFPYTITVRAESAAVRSGPAEVHYATSHLSKGEQVEVFRHDPNGWCAIRPPVGEFSLVRAKYLIASPSKGTGKCTRDGVRVWVGTTIVDPSVKAQEPMWQVQLKRGDQVRVLAKKQVNDTSGRLNHWYKIAPPAGEFRWIHDSAFNDPLVSSSTPPIETRDTGNASIPALTNTQEKPAIVVSGIPDQENGLSGKGTQQEPRHNPLQPKPFEPAPIQQSVASQSQNAVVLPRNDLTQQNLDSVTGMKAQRLVESNGWQVIEASEADSPMELPAEFSPKATQDSYDSARSNSAVELTSHERGLPGTRPAGESIQISGDFADQIGQLEYELTMAVVKPVSQWRLEPYARAAARLNFSANQPDQQFAINAFLKKIEAFQRLKQQQLRLQPQQGDVSSLAEPDVEKSQFDIGNAPPVQIATYDTGSQAIGSGVRQVAGVEQAEAQGSSETDTVQYDAVGWLTRLYTQNGKGRTGYALQDSTGKILRTVLPAPGVNLERYIDQEVGIFGKVGYNAKYNLPHVTADQVIVLADLK